MAYVDMKISVMIDPKTDDLKVPGNAADLV